VVRIEFALMLLYALLNDCNGCNDVKEVVRDSCEQGNRNSPPPPLEQWLPSETHDAKGDVLNS